MNFRQIFSLLQAAAARWNDSRAPRLGASLAYYALLSTAPLLMLLIAIFAIMFNEATAQRDLLAQVRDLAGYREALTVKNILDSAHHSGSGALATVVALTTLLFGASGVFVELRDSLNLLWGASVRKRPAAWSFLLTRAISFLMVLAMGALMLASILVSAAMSTVEKWFGAFLPPSTAVLGVAANFLASLTVLAILFALLFRFVPDMRLPWRPILAGAGLTAVLFEIGKLVLSLYVGMMGVGSAYGAAGSLIALVVWVYYSAQIFFFGAAFTRVYADAKKPGLR